MSTPKPAAPLSVFTVQQYEAPTGKTGTSWTKIGVAFPHHDGPGFSIELRALPTNGRLVVLAPRGGTARHGARGLVSAGASLGGRTALPLFFRASRLPDHAISIGSR
jgi:hypothetical protein